MNKRILPPTYFLLFLVMTIGLHFILPIKKFINSPFNYLGILLIGAGIWLNLHADKLFKNKQTTVKPFEESSCLIEEGPFVFSRNLMYLGIAAILSGISACLGSVTPFIGPVLFFIIINFKFINEEEKVLEQTFGQDFLEYKKRVRRWL